MRRGFTLIEVLLYLGIAAIILSVFSTLFFSLLRVRDQQRVITEVRKEGTRIMQIITQIVRNADQISAPVLGGENNTLSLIVFVPGGGTMTTVIDLLDNQIRLTEGANPPLVLNNTSGVASGLLFSNVGRAGTAGSIKAQFTLRAGTYAKNFYGSASLRSH